MLLNDRGVVALNQHVVKYLAQNVSVARSTARALSRPSRSTRLQTDFIR